MANRNGHVVGCACNSCKKRRREKLDYYSETAFAKNHMKPWSPIDDLKVILHDITDRELSIEIGRSMKAIQTRRLTLRKLGDIA